MEKPIEMREFANAILATQQPGYVSQNLNEACNRRATLALTTVEAAIKARQCAIESEEPDNEPQRISRFVKLTLIEDLMDDIKTIKRGFTI